MWRRRLIAVVAMVTACAAWPARAEALTYKFSALSKGYVAAGQEGHAAFERNGVRFLTRLGGAGGGRGINITVVHERTADILDFRNFDLWANGQTAADEMKLYLSSLPSGRVLLVAIGDEGGLTDTNCQPRASWVEAVFATFEALGSQHIRQVCFRHAWAMVAVNGVSPARAEAFGPEAQVATASLRFRDAVAIASVDYSPYRAGQSPSGPCPTLAEIQADMTLLKSMAKTVRTYGLHGCDLGQKILGATNAARIRTAVGVWLDGNLAGNDAEIEKLEELTNAGLLKRTDVVIVGSEVLLRGELSVQQLVDYLNRVKAIVAPRGIPVTTAEIWPTWLDEAGQSLAGVVDHIYINVLPYWESIPVATATAFVVERYTQVWARHPFKRVVISETGWPTHGPAKGLAVPSVVNQELFLRSFLCQVIRQRRLPFFVFEAFDEPWKAATTEGEVGAHWGFFDVNRQPKQSFTSLESCPR